jgi:hypothetical protein
LVIQLVQDALAVPPGLRTRPCRCRPLFLRRKLRPLSTNPLKNQLVPTDHVKNDLPNAVSARYWMGCRILRRDTIQYFAHRRAMPGLAPKGPADLICDDLHVHHHLSHLPTVGLTPGISCERPIRSTLVSFIPLFDRLVFERSSGTVSAWLGQQRGVAG